MPPKDDNGRMKYFELWLERLLWNSRLIMLVGVAAGLVIALAAIYLGLVDTVHMFGVVASYGSPAISSADKLVFRSQAVTYMVKSIDAYLIAAIMIIFSVGLYELFVSRIEMPEGASFNPRELRVKSLDDLKNRIMRLVLLVLIIEFFQHALSMNYDSPLDLLYLALAILLIGGAFWLTNQNKHQE
jgi:uncharacterized membrane protein YqhA